MTTEEAKIRITMTDNNTGESLKVSSPPEPDHDNEEDTGDQIEKFLSRMRKNNVVQKLADPLARNHTTNVTVKVNEQSAKHVLNFGVDLTPWMTETGNKNQDIYNAIQRLRHVDGIKLGSYPVFLWVDEDGDRVPVRFTFQLNYSTELDGLVLVFRSSSGSGLSRMFGGSNSTSNGTLSATVRTRIANSDDLILESQSTSGTFTTAQFRKQSVLVRDIAKNQWYKSLNGKPVFHIQAAFDLETVYYTTEAYYFSETPESTPANNDTDEEEEE
jgi:hypothetical protein